MNPKKKAEFEIENQDYKVSRCEPHDQIIHFVGGYKRSIFNVVYIWENEMTHVVNAAGIEWVINKDNVLCVEKIRRSNDG